MRHVESYPSFMAMAIKVPKGGPRDAAGRASPFSLVAGLTFDCKEVLTWKRFRAAGIWDPKSVAGQFDEVGYCCWRLVEE